MDSYQGKIEAILFTMGEPVDIEELAAAVEIEPAEALEKTLELQRLYEEEGRGIRILRLENSFQMTTGKDFYEVLIKLASKPKRPVMTEALLETLAIIAYRQPVTKPDITAIRGVSSDFAVNRLLEYGLIQEAGRKNAPGRPILFTTTEEFLRRFQIESAEVLPELPSDKLIELQEEVYSEIGYMPEQEQ